MNKRVTAMKAGKAKTALVKRDRNSPAIKVTGRDKIAVKAGTMFRGMIFRKDTPVPTEPGLAPGSDYAVHVKRGKLVLLPYEGINITATMLGGFHFAPGGNAKGDEGGDATPAINPCSVWDRNFRPACPNPRGMTLVATASGKFWCDIYLLAKCHLDQGTSLFGVTIADGNDAPRDIKGGFFPKLDFATAAAVMKCHGKQLLSAEEFFAAAYGVKERSSHDGDPKVTKCDAPRTSRFGVMQATGNLWIWGTDGHPVDPRPSIFGGSWVLRSNAGSRCALLGYLWPEVSTGVYGARGRSDHLQLA